MWVRATGIYGPYASICGFNDWPIDEMNDVKNTLAQFVVPSLDPKDRMDPFWFFSVPMDVSRRQLKASSMHSTSSNWIWTPNSGAFEPTEIVTLDRSEPEGWARATISHNSWGWAGLSTDNFTRWNRGGGGNGSPGVPKLIVTGDHARSCRGSAGRGMPTEQSKMTVYPCISKVCSTSQVHLRISLY